MSDIVGTGGQSEENDKIKESSRSGTDEPVVSPVVSTDRPGSESPSTAAPEAPAVRWIYRHALPVRLAHWINVFCLPILVMSGLQIFNAHPALYWGERSDRDRPILSLDTDFNDTGGIRGITTVLGYSFDTTGWLGASNDSAGQIHRRGFPAWATIPSFQWLAMGRRWHFFFAWVFVFNGVLFGLYTLLSRHFDRDLFPFPKDIRGIGRAVLDHLRFRHPAGEEAARYNVLQKIAYTGVVFVLGPLIVLTGMTMSPRMDAAFPGLLTLFGGRQSARTVHFIVCFAFVGYTGVHLFMVAVTGLWNNLRSMVIGRYRIAEPGVEHHDPRPN
ncbi:MAG: cytochrome b/b6 domain-containing protein [Nitrospirae bacterium]|nr:cytochrome b/b6 domain-containing protein [Nitrospirota bacterium]